MRKLFITLLSIFVITFAAERPAFAINAVTPTPTPIPFSALSIRLEQPKTPTNQQVFDIVFVTLDLEGRDVTVTCWKQAPGDGGYIQFGSTNTYTGGNTGVCSVDSTIINTKGNYNFKVIASAGSDTKEDSVALSYNNEGPGDPTGYSKERINSCDYKIKFHTADDVNKTVKVEVYRSENTSFTADSGSRVDTISIGSNTDGQSITTAPNCNKNYYFAIRAFDSTGNGSNIVGDSETKVTTTSTTSSQPTQGAIALGTPGTGSVLGGETESSKEGTILGETTPSATTQSESGIAKFFKKDGILILGIILLAIGAIGLYVSKKKKE